MHIYKVSPHMHKISLFIIISRIAISEMITSVMLNAQMTIRSIFYPHINSCNIDKYNAF